MCAWASSPASASASGRCARRVGVTEASVSIRASAVSVLSGPTSMWRATPSDSSVWMPSAKRTASRACWTQYAGVAISVARELAAQIGDDRQPRRGVGEALRHRAELVQHRVHQPRVERVADRQPRRLAALLAPVRLQLADRAGRPGDHDRARPVDRREVERVGGSCNSSSAAWMASIAPPSGSAPINRPRALISAQASASERTPATCAAATSPTEWPITTSGAIPKDSSSRYSATSSANSAGWVCSVRSSALASRTSVLCSPSGQLLEHLVERVREHRVELVQLGPHARALRALAGEQERGLAASRASRGARCRRSRPAPARPGRAAGRRRRRRRAARTASGAWPAPRRRRPATPAGSRPATSAAAWPARAPPPRSCPRAPAAAAAGTVANVVRRRGRLLDDQVRVGAADAEGRHAGAARCARRAATPRLG